MSGTRSRRDKETGEVFIAGWGYPPQWQKSEGGTGVIITLPSTMLKAYADAAGATIDDWYELVNEEGATTYSASAEIQEAIMDVYAMKGLIAQSRNEPIFDIKDDEFWTPG